MKQGKPQSAAPSRTGQKLNAEAAWQQILVRDPNADFFYAVTTTGVFCRPGCASRRPLRTNVRFFRTADEARSAGFRPCQRCAPAKDRSPDKSGAALERVRAHIEAHAQRPVPLAELGKLAAMSPFTVQRLFKRQMGVSPLQYQRALRAGSLRGALKKGETVTNAIYEAGFSSSSRVYEGAQLGMTPARFAQGGRGEQIGFTTARTPFGWIVVGATGRGLCWLALADSSSAAEATVREEFPAATLRRDPSLALFVDAALAAVAGDAKQAAAGTLPPADLDLRGTAFQLKVWQALRQIPRGETRTYSQLARELGNANATRAVARACALNRVSLMVPCHRVVGASGSLTGYRWGVDRKRQLLEAERGNAERGNR
ncbi:MAG TPA: methylated-DNA--[protein]-cysteine S-methyltransferase [Terracidiphilus sp.]|jgi:AraC family transcriptional regulator of adaptative response/methylated-DNA-[protein]-cysteine methyltransferase|nr:methylated-DNA--[protein]-cysteine S-methyltransferase [Terracidiphilus sp.]